MLDNIQHLIFDIGLFFRWLFEILKLLFEAMFRPVSFFYNFASTFISNVSFSPTQTAPISFLAQVQTILDAIPLWSTLSLVVGAGFLFLIGFKLFHLMTD